jgi:hypothetical protein
MTAVAFTLAVLVAIEVVERTELGGRGRNTGSSRGGLLSAQHGDHDGDTDAELATLRAAHAETTDALAQQSIVIGDLQARLSGLAEVGGDARETGNAGQTGSTAATATSAPQPLPPPPPPLLPPAPLPPPPPLLPLPSPLPSSSSPPLLPSRAVEQGTRGGADAVDALANSGFPNVCSRPVSAPNASFEVPKGGRADEYTCSSAKTTPVSIHGLETRFAAHAGWEYTIESIMQRNLIGAKPGDFSKMKSGDTVFITSDRVSVLASELRDRKLRVDLITGGSDYGTPLGVVKRSHGGFDWERMLRENVRVWFAQNYDLNYTHPQASACTRTLSDPHDISIA